MNRDEKEMALWRQFAVAVGFDTADAAVERFRKRFPPQPVAPPAAVWHDAPPRPGEYHVEGLSRVCWVDEDVVWYPAWDSAGERPRIREMPRAGRRVSPIIRPDDPPQPVAPEAVWHDEPPFEKDTANYPCWIEGYKLPGIVLWDGEEWRMYVAGDGYADPLAGRRVCPITKPQEPTT